MNTTTFRPPCFGPKYRQAENVATALALLVNALLTWLVVKRSQKEIRGFKRVLLLGCGVDSVFAICSNLFEIHIDIWHGFFIAVNSGPFLQNTPWGNHVVYSLYLFPVYFTIAFVSVPMVFSYFIVCRNHVMSCSQIAVLLLMVALATSALTASEVFFWYPLAERTSTKRASVLARRECYDEGEVPILDVDDIESLFKPSAFGPLLAAGGISTGSYIVIIACVAAMRRTLRHLNLISERTRSLQRQLDYAFLAQCIAPLLLVVVPIVGCIFAAFGFEQFTSIARMCTSCISFIAICNPLCAIVFIKSYRRGVVRYVQKCIPRRCHVWVNVKSGESSGA